MKTIKSFLLSAALCGFVSAPAEKTFLETLGSCCAALCGFSTDRVTFQQEAHVRREAAIARASAFARRQQGQYPRVQQQYSTPQPRHAQPWSSSAAASASSGSRSSSSGQTQLNFKIAVPSKTRPDYSVKGGRTALSKFIREVVDNKLGADKNYDFGLPENSSGELGKFTVEWNTTTHKLISLSVKEFLNKGKKVLGRGAYKTVILRHTRTGEVSEIIIGGKTQSGHLAFHA